MFLPIDAEIYVSERRDRLLREAESYRLARLYAPERRRLVKRALYHLVSWLEARLSAARLALHEHPES